MPSPKPDSTMMTTPTRINSTHSGRVLKRLLHGATDGIFRPVGIDSVEGLSPFCPEEPP
jgi:hypothetical protein